MKFLHSPSIYQSPSIKFVSLFYEFVDVAHSHPLIGFISFHFISSHPTLLAAPPFTRWIQYHHLASTPASTHMVLSYTFKFNVYPHLPPANNCYLGIQVLQTLPSQTCSLETLKSKRRPLPPNFTSSNWLVHTQQATSYCSSNQGLVILAS